MRARRPCCLFVAAVAAALFAASAQAENIRTAVPGLNLNYLSVFSADARGFFRDEGLENETIVIGGFVRKNDSNSMQKIPVLGDLPIVGSLFRTVSKTTEDRELLIFVTPVIIPDVGGGTVGENVIP